MTTEYVHEYPPAEWTVDDIATALREAPERFPIPTYDDASFWRSVREDDAVRGIVDAARAAAAEAAAGPVTPLPASGYLEYEREGTRTGYPEKRRRKELAALVVAECIDRDGEYLDPILDYVWAHCEQSTWVRPAHLPGSEAYLEGLPRPVAAEDRHVALQSAGNAKLLAEVAYVLGDRLHPAARERVAREIDDRVLTPYLATDDFPWLHPPAANHNAVCNGSVLIAALHAEDDPDRQARIVAKAARSMGHYLDSFDADGCTAEGVGYWKYGFAFYVTAAAHLERRTDGEFSLFSPPIVRDVAAFPLAVELSPNRFPPFSDATEANDVTPFIACKAGERLDRPALFARGRADLERRDEVGYVSSAIRNLAWCRDAFEDRPTETPSPPRRSFFRGCEWWLARTTPDDPHGLVVAAKGGHNDEPHNHNDCGSFVVHYRGESLLTDPGPAEYVSGYFDDERYDFLAARSLGHSVPRVNGHEQAAGRDYAAEVRERTCDDERDRFVLDLADCYPAAAGLDSLRREFVLDRTAGADGIVRVSDAVRFDADASGRRFESMLVSHDPIASSEEGLVVTGEDATATVAVESAVDVETERLEVHELRRGDLWRARLVPPAAGCEVTLEVTVEPEPRG